MTRRVVILLTCPARAASCVSGGSATGCDGACQGGEATFTGPPPCGASAHLRNVPLRLTGASRLGHIDCHTPPKTSGQKSAL